MSERKKVLFVNPGHFGSLTDTYFYCINLKDLYDISYFGIFEEEIGMQVDGISITNIRLSGNKLLRKFIFVIKLKRFLKKNKFDFVFVNYFLGCSLLHIFRKSSINIDVRTSTIGSCKFKTSISNLFLRLEVNSFSKITCISQSLTDYLRLSKRTHILPVGAPNLPLIKRDLSSLRLLYVGTFRGRNIEKTILAFSKFLSKHRDKSIAIYTIVGYGTDFETKLVKDAILSQGMENNVFFKGKIQYPELVNYFLESNIGVSYIPLQNYFENQPPTKTFEYLLSGMPVLATMTKENQKVITNENGLLVGDSVDDFCEGLENIYVNRYKFNPANIQLNASKFSWENIVRLNLYEYIKKSS